MPKVIQRPESKVATQPPDQTVERPHELDEAPTRQLPLPPPPRRYGRWLGWLLVAAIVAVVGFMIYSNSTDNATTAELPTTSVVSTPTRAELGSVSLSEWMMQTNSPNFQPPATPQIAAVSLSEWMRQTNSPNFRPLMTPQAEAISLSEWMMQTSSPDFTP